jgi:hypothetical protein
MSTNRFAPLTLLAVIVVAATGCTTGSPSPSPEPTPRPTPTPVGAAVTNPQEAAALVIASNPLFEGAEQMNPDVIGASKWWTASPLAAGGYVVEVTIGWGDCQAGCIERHVWTYDVHADGTLELVSESGDPVPADLPG